MIFYIYFFIFDIKHIKIIKKNTGKNTIVIYLPAVHIFKTISNAFSNIKINDALA
jgi:hypothetical protein